MYLNPRFTAFFLVAVLAGQVLCRPLLALRNEDKFNKVKLDNAPRDLPSVRSVECCTMTFTSTTLSNGAPGVQVVQNCNVIIADTCPPPSSQPITPSSSTSAPVTSTVSTSPSSTFTPAPGSTISTSSLPSSSLLSSTTDAPPSPTTTLSFSPPTSAPTSSLTSDTPNTSTSSAAIASPKQSTILPKVIGAFAGVSIICLIVGGTIGYLKQKKLKEKDEHISWPATR